MHVGIFTKFVNVMSLLNNWKMFHKWKIILIDGNVKRLNWCITLKYYDYNNLKGQTNMILQEIHWSLIYMLVYWKFAKQTYQN